MKRLPGLALLLLLAAGCATTPRPDWAARVGTYTYEQAVLELGPPDKSETLSDGTVVAEWLVRRGYARGGSGFVHGFYGHPYYFPGPVWMHSDPPVPDLMLRLIFGPDKILHSWKRYAR
jgi:hypothetical protein